MSTLSFILFAIVVSIASLVIGAAAALVWFGRAVRDAIGRGLGW
jgi:hypothetical protein